MATAAAVGTAIVGILFVRGSGSPAPGRSGPSVAALRVAPSCVDSPCEAACGIWQHRLHRGTAMPVGGFGRDIGRALESRFRTPVTDMALPTDFPDPPSDRDIDLVILGESSAEGVPYSNWLSLGSLLTWKMSQAIPGRPIRARVIARSGDTLEWQHRELANLPRRPDLLIIYCGHNEFTSRLAESRELAALFRRMAADGLGHARGPDRAVLFRMRLDS